MGEDDLFAAKAIRELRRIADTEDLTEKDNTILLLVAAYLERSFPIPASRLTTS